MIRALLLALTSLLLALTIACGGDDDATPTPDLGLGASLPRHLTGVSPANGSLIANAELAGNGETAGICATFTFGDGDGMGDDPTSLVKLSVQGEDVTDSATFLVTSSAPPTGGTICYAPP